MHYLALSRSADHLAVSDVDRNVVDVGGGAVVDEVADLEWLSGWDHGSGFVLGLCGAGQVDAGGLVGGAGQAGAVPAAFGRAVSAPQVGKADLSLGVEDRGVAGVGWRGVGGEAAGGAVLVKRPRTLQAYSARSWALKSRNASIALPSGWWSVQPRHIGS